MSSFPIDIELSRLIALEYAFGLVDETVIIVVFIHKKSF